MDAKNDFWPLRLGSDFPSGRISCHHLLTSSLSPCVLRVNNLKALSNTGEPASGHAFSNDLDNELQVCTDVFLGVLGWPLNDACSDIFFLLYAGDTRLLFWNADENHKF